MYDQKVNSFKKKKLAEEQQSFSSLFFCQDEAEEQLQKLVRKCEIGGSEEFPDLSFNFNKAQQIIDNSIRLKEKIIDLHEKNLTNDDLNYLLENIKKATCWSHPFQ